MTTAAAGGTTGRAHPRNAGIALVLTVALLAALGVISLSALALARTERAVGLAALARVQARGAAEAALAHALPGWPGAMTPPNPGDSVRLVSLVLPGRAVGLVTLRALGGPIYALEASGVRTAVAGDTLGSARLELLVLLEPPDSLAVVRPRPYPRGWRLLP